MYSLKNSLLPFHFLVECVRSVSLFSFSSLPAGANIRTPVGGSDHAEQAGLVMGCAVIQLLSSAFRR